MSVTACPIRPVQPRRIALATAVCCTALALAVAALHSSLRADADRAAARGGGAPDRGHRAARRRRLPARRRPRPAPARRLVERAPRPLRPGPRRSPTTMVNADLLLVHAVAAQRGHTGPARRRRARGASSASSSSSPIWTERVRVGADPQAHGPGWVTEPGRLAATWSIDTEVVDGLVHAYRARRALALPDRSRARSATRSTASPRAVTGAGRRCG